MSDEEFLLFMSCTISITQPETAKLIQQVLDKAGAKYKLIDEPCCGGELFRLGDLSGAKEQAEKAYKIFKNNNIKKIVTYCPECYVTLKHEYPTVIEGFDIEIFHLTETVSLALTGR